ncbi:hypothetical protein [Kitasatospora sp. NPDC088783]|uniref:hypothetical protein n=1 Tax=Kitasatospora sp. NPDC088783 TaxID=3364077 RepID=UPI00382FF5A7
MSHLTDVPPGLLQQVLGPYLAHLRATGPHLRPALPPRLDPGKLESVRGSALHEAIKGGDLEVIAHAYAPGDKELKAWLHAVTTAPGYGWLSDTGPGADHRYQVLEESADSVLITTPSIHDLPVLTDRMRTWLHRERRSVKRLLEAGESAPAVPGWGPVPDVSPAQCLLCALLRRWLLRTDARPEHEREWRGRVATARAEAFLERLGRAGAQVTIVINERTVRELSHIEEHTGQLGHLAHLAADTALELRCARPSQPVLNCLNLLDLDGTVLAASWAAGAVLYEPALPGDLDYRTQRALSAQDTLRLVRRAATGPLPEPRCPPAPARRTTRTSPTRGQLP